MFNPTDAYMSFTSQVANTPNWWESLARAATAPLFMTGIRMYNKYSKPKEVKPTDLQVNSDATRKAVTATADRLFGMPQFQANLGLNYTDPYGNTFTPTEIQQPWTADVNERLNPTSKWQNPLLANLKNNLFGNTGNFFNPTTPATQTTNNQNAFNAKDYINLNPYPQKYGITFDWR